MSEAPHLLDLASMVDLEPYDLLNTFRLNHRRDPTVAEMAEYIADARMLEAEALVRRYENRNYGKPT